MVFWSDSQLDFWAHWGNYLGLFFPILGTMIGAFFVYVAIQSTDVIGSRKSDKDAKDAAGLQRAIHETQRKANTSEEHARILAEENKALAGRVAIAEANAQKAKARTDKRTLTTEARQRFVAGMAPFRGDSVAVYHDSRYPEAGNFADILSAALNDSGVGFGENSGITYSPAPEGIVVYCTDPDHPSRAAAGLIAALQSAGIGAVLEPAPGWAVVSNPGWAGLWIGAKPQD